MVALSQVPRLQQPSTLSRCTRIWRLSIVDTNSRECSSPGGHDDQQRRRWNVGGESTGLIRFEGTALSLTPVRRDGG